MGIRVALHHKTVYNYDRLVTLSPQVVRLRPAPHSRTPVTSYSLRVEPAAHFINWQQDPQGNFVARLTFPEPTRRFSLEVDLVAEMTVINPFDFFLEPTAETVPFAYDAGQREELRPFLAVPPPGPRLAAWLATVDRTGTATIDFLVALNQRVQREVRYLTRMEPGVQTSEDTLDCASGSCRDSAWLLVEIFRHLGLAARFVSGYLIQLTPDEKPLEGPEGPSHDFTDLHAWAEVYLPGAGWVGLDPTSGLFAGEGHIPLAATPAPESAAPVSGLVGPSQVEFEHEMRVTRIREDPRVTRPYSDDQWDAILQLGDRIDRELVEGDVRLTMGGEPTFVSIDDMEGEEWNTAAMGPTKQRLAGALVRRLRERYAPGGLLHFGQGKWYPGEPLPRWAFTCYWRTDGAPLWNDPALLGDPAQPGSAGEAEAEIFADALADRLTVGKSFVIAAYEDPLAYIHQEHQLPVNVDPEHNTLDDPQERERLRRVFSRGLGRPSGFVLPLVRAAGKDGPTWQSGLWMLRAQHLFLIPGDSPVGFRLPLHSLLDEDEDDVRQVWTIDPMSPQPPLATPVRRRVPRPATAAPEQTSVPGQARDGGPARQQQNAQTLGTTAGESLVRTALTVEPRGGSLWVFLPPLESGDDYVDLLAAIEDTAASLEQPVLIEGYPPPFDPRIQQIKVTPDPGVIEVNVQPARGWRELVDNTTTLYAEARQSRLGTEKFMLDGRHTGTGGGNHIVLGGPTPADSPFLRRPDLLRSFVAYWLNHPSLSYLFSGVFIGPTSQAPRVDETRADAIYELEIAMRLLDDEGVPCPPWLVDRIFRNLLVDVTGNTHRAEFCIDKLYSPDSATGRLGLVELRGFEMPPHARMSLAQQLLVRALLARFWRTPYAELPVRWGTRLHDRFLLPHYVEHDLRRVIRELQEAGYPVQTEWFAPFVEFRFPVYGRVSYEGIEIELRQAIEPWYVLGEEPGAGGTARYVDSSVERLQVRVSGLLPERYTVACNGFSLPLQSTATAGEFVCGVRYRAWQPPRCLHPTIKVHAPLVIDLIDTYARRSIGGCTYHVAHPGGRNYATFPVNSNEAEARRRARFFAMGHTPGSPLTPIATENPEFPSTLDLRRAHMRRLS
ncbi:MAG TPA: transglutaminase family protein [Vicinamibacterales bacterium]|nr:transglutaminase family protein [Vicinamibacterales bacterium]